MFTKLVFLYTFSNILFVLSNAQNVNVKLPLGELIGSTRKNLNGKTFYAFRGIPYAEPPTGDFRFQAARAKLPWNGTLDARKEKHYCYQMNFNNNQENEDCLFINVFTPASPSSNSKLPVMFFIYGGGFIEGYATEGNYGPLHLMDYDVILVTFNYRVGPFGFFSLGDKVVPGNAGLKDQNLALKWTNQYIQYFGGDPKKITIFGHSAGSASVAYHLLSPKSNGLFRAAICESGSALSPWAYQRNLVQLSYKLVTNIDPYAAGSKNSSTDELYKYLKTLTAKQIDEASELFLKTEHASKIQLQQGFFFTPTIEVDHEDAFLTQKMFDLFKNGEYNKVPIIIGVNSEESYFYVDYRGFPQYAKSFDNNNKLLIPHDMKVVGKNEDLVASTIKKFYVHSYGNFSYNLRNFIKPPVAKKPWSGTMDVSKAGNMCIQGSDNIIGSEDCLFLKVYTTQAPNRNNKLPVMVWIYGGTFLSGFPDFDDHSVDYLLDEGVMIVTFHYRVGVLGFLSTGDNVVPGNNGIKDQAMALKWIKENIQNFGGDPDKITIFGQSAGGASVAYLLQAKQTQGLFHRAILQSGSSLNAWSLSRHSNKVTHSLASELEVSTLSSQAIAEGLRMIDAKVLQKASMDIMNKLIRTNNPLQGLIFSPVIEPEHDGAIILEKSHELLKNGGFHKVPIMIGHTSLEANMENMPVALRFWLAQYDLNKGKLVPNDMNADESQLGNIGSKIKLKYFGLSSVALSTDKLMRFISEDQFVRGIVESARLYSKISSVYYYQFSHIGPLWGKTNKRKGAAHTEDLGYLFDFGHQGSETDYLVRNRMVRMWTNFAKTGSPTPYNDALLSNVNWEPNHSGTNNLRCLDISANLKMIDAPHKAHMDFYGNLYQNYGNEPFDTY